MLKDFIVGSFALIFIIFIFYVLVVFVSVLTQFYGLSLSEVLGRLALVLFWVFIFTWASLYIGRFINSKIGGKNAKNNN